MAIPFLWVINSRTVELYWSPPSTPNGLISGYTIQRSTNNGAFSQITALANNTLNYTNDQLQPSIRYSYKIVASNQAGSVSSPAVTVTMPSSTPEGIQAPSNVTVLGPTSIYVQWREPSTPNGVIDQFKVVLNAGTLGEEARSVGLAFNTVVTGLKPYTKYSVRIQACLSAIPNGCGLGPAVEVTTQEAAPTGQMPPELVAKASDTVLVKWAPPQQPNGVITSYRIHRRAYPDQGSGNIIDSVNGEVLSIVNTAQELKPYTEYEYMVTAVNSKGSSPSAWAKVRTLAAPPQVLYAPLVTLIGAHYLGLSWGPPLSPNGVISQYRVEYREVLEDPTTTPTVIAVTVGPSARSTSVSGLKPYTAYQVRVVAVNSAGSVISQWTQTTTGQAPPSGVGPFAIEKMDDGQSVILQWSEPAHPNGIINSYLIYEGGNINPVYQGLTREFEYRRLQPYTQYKVQLEACTNGGCAKSTPQYFYTAEITPKNQPAPTMGQVNATHVVLRWSKPINANGKILQYEVLRKNNGRISKRDVSSEGQIVYSTTATDAEEFEFTDSGLEPYTHYQYAVRASNSIGSTQSAWQSVETSQAPPTGVAPPIASQVPNDPSKLLLRWSAPTKPNGVLQYYQLQRNNSVPMSFAPTDPKEYTDTNLKAHTLYSYVLTVCSGGGCTSSNPTLIQTSETAPSYVAPPKVTTVSSDSILAQWTEPQITNGRIQVYHLKVDESTVYSGLNLEYTVTNLVPNRAYSFYVQACTFGGCTNSTSVVGRPQEAPPTGMKRPSIKVTGSASIEISWSPPTNPNGVITSYEVNRDGVMIATTSLLVYTDYDVKPGKTYSYTVTAYNSQDSITSPAIAATTYASAPAGLAPPVLEALSSTSIRASWSEPSQPNGEIHNYTLYKDLTDIVYSERGFSTTVTRLKHWTEYSFRVEACTINGCTMSDVAFVKTLEAAPQGLAPPTLTAIADATGAMESVFAEWSPPISPNGVITKYDLYRRNYTGSREGKHSKYLPRDFPSHSSPLFATDVASVTGKLLYSGTGLNYQDQDPTLLPFTYYEYGVMASNSEGSTRSQWNSVLTKEAPPSGVPAPVIRVSTLH